MTKDGEKPYAINTEKAGCYSQAIRELRHEGNTQHRQVKYLNNVVKADHGKLKRLIKPTLGFKSRKKRQANSLNFSSDIKGEIRIIERAFGLGNCVMADMMNELEIRLKAV